MSVLIRLDELIHESISLQTLRILLRKNNLSVIGDEFEKTQTLHNAILAEEIRFREDFLHFIPSEEICEIAYQIGLETEGPTWKIKEDICFWFQSQFENLSGWDERENVSFSSQEELLNWIETGSLEQLKKICSFIQRNCNAESLLFHFDEVNSKREALSRISIINPRVLMKAVESIMLSEYNHKKRQQELSHIGTQMTLREAYRVLGLNNQIDSSTLKRRYFDLMKKVHPDSRGDSSDIDNSSVLRVQNAYEKIKSTRSDLR